VRLSVCVCCVCLLCVFVVMCGVCCMCVGSVEQGVARLCVVCVLRSVLVIFCFLVCLLLSALHFWAHPLTTLLCLAALFVDDGARCVQLVSLPPSCVCLCVFVVCVCSLCVGGGIGVLCGVCCICLLRVIMCVDVRG